MKVGKDKPAMLHQKFFISKQKEHTSSKNIFSVLFWTVDRD